MHRRSVFLALPFLALSIVTACGGGGHRVPSVPPPVDAATSLAPQPEPLDPEQQAHLLLRTQWAVLPEEQRALAELGVSAWLARQFDVPEDPAVEADASRRLPYPMQPTGAELTQWWLRLLSRTRQPLRATMAALWHDHFAVSQQAFSATTTMHLMLAHLRRLHTIAFDDLRALVLAITTDPAMQVWLDGTDSVRGQPNENLAREFYERFTLGVDRGYTLADIAETARAFTGYALVPAPGGVMTVAFDPARHDTGDKTVFGRTGRFDVRAIVDLTFAERDVAGFFARRLFEHFCYPNPPDSVVAELAAVLRRNDYALRPTLTTLLSSRAFFSAAARRSSVKSPLEAAIGLVRATGLEFPEAVLDFLLMAQGQRPTQPPDVGGWPEDTAWLTTGSLIPRASFAHALAVNREYQALRGNDITRLLPRGAQTTAAEAVASLAWRLGVVLERDDANDYLRYLDTRTWFVGSELHSEPDPFVASNPVHIAERYRGLLFLLTQHPSFLLR